MKQVKVNRKDFIKFGASVVIGSCIAEGYLYFYKNERKDQKNTETVFERLFSNQKEFEKKWLTINQKLDETYRKYKNKDPKEFLLLLKSRGYKIEDYIKHNKNFSMDLEHSWERFSKVKLKYWNITAADMFYSFYALPNESLYFLDGIKSSDEYSLRVNLNKRRDRSNLAEYLTQKKELYTKHGGYLPWLPDTIKDLTVSDKMSIQFLDELEIPNNNKDRFDRFFWENFKDKNT